MSHPYPFLVGVTGGLGSGKSAVCSMLSELGCALFESDRVAKELQLSDPEVIDGITTLFGAAVYSSDPEGRLLIDRKIIAATVFSDAGKREALNRLIHPRVFQEFCKVVHAAEKAGIKILVREAAILFESGGERGLDAVVVVAAALEERIERAVRKGMGTPAEIRQRIAAQWPQEHLISRADYVLFNRASLDELRKDTTVLFHTLLTVAEQVCGNS